MKIIGLTGGIGSGKSTVTEYLISKGFHVLDADEIARQIVEPGSDALIEIASVFGNGILLEDGNLDRKRLGDIVFSDVEKKIVLDKIMHTRILEIIYERIVNIREITDKAVFIDAPLLFETGLDKYVTEIWVVDAEDEIRIRRIMERDNLNRVDILKRIANQMDRQEKNNRANKILNNSGEFKELYTQIDELIKNI